MHYVNAVRRSGFKILRTMIQILKIQFEFLYLFLTSFAYHSHFIKGAFKVCLPITSGSATRTAAKSPHPVTLPCMSLHEAQEQSCGSRQAARQATRTGFSTALAPRRMLLLASCFLSQPRLPRHTPVPAEPRRLKLDFRASECSCEQRGCVWDLPSRNLI